MDEKSIAFEVIAVVTGVIGGLWAVGKAVLTMRDNLDRRIDRLERDSVTRPELAESLKQLRDEHRADLQRIDNKLEAMNGNIMLLVHALGEKK